MTGKEKRGRIYLPETIEASLAKTVKGELAGRYGGYTVIEARGGWVNERKDLITENVEVLEVSDENLTKEKLQSLADWVKIQSNESVVRWELSEITVGME